MTTDFQQLNKDWNAAPNAVDPKVRFEGTDLVLSFAPNRFQFPSYEGISLIELFFLSCKRYRLGPTNDEGWYRGQCRFSGIAPKWGEFYKVEGDLLLDQLSDEWIEPKEATPEDHHYLFYFRDESFECDALGWRKRDIA